jgi:hypothetical protein
MPALAVELPGAYTTPVPSPCPATLSADDSGDTERIALLQSSSGTTGGGLKLVLLPHRQLTWRYPQPFWWEGPEQVGQWIGQLTLMLAIWALFPLWYTIWPGKQESGRASTTPPTPGERLSKG